MDAVIVLLVLVAITVGLTLLVVKIVSRYRCKPYANRKEALSTEVAQMEAALSALKVRHTALDAETKDLQTLAGREQELAASVAEKQDRLRKIEEKIASVQDAETEADKHIHAIQAKVDLYSRIDDFVDYGMYEMPDYLYETSERFALEIKQIREQQKAMIQAKQVIITQGTPEDFGESPLIRRVMQEQIKLMVRSFNIECDLLIAKVNPGNLQRTLERIDAVATGLEKSGADLRYGFNTEYVNLKYQECRLQYQFALKKKEEQDEQRAIREQMREEERARREYEKAIEDASREEATYERLLEKARKALETVKAEEKQAAELRIQQLEEELAEARAKAQRAISMAQQTKKGYVYVISNIGSFGENVYKIGLTRRLDPRERVRELGDASVPFSFDIHALIASENAPALETALHKAFDRQRVNAVNLRKEFFRVSLDDIRKKAEELTGRKSDFVMTILAEENYQTKRMQGNTSQG